MNQLEFTMMKEKLLHNRYSIRFRQSSASVAASLLLLFLLGCSSIDRSDLVVAQSLPSKRQEVSSMHTMIKLKLPEDKQTLDKVISLPGMKGLNVDKNYGLICISPNESLYIVRTGQVDHLEERKAASPEILDIYGDVRISPFGTPSY